MNWLDYLLAIGVILSIVAGAVKGFARVGIGVIAAILGIVCGLWFCGTAGAFLRPYVSSKLIADFAGFVLVFLAAVLAGALLGMLLEKVFNWVGLKWLDRVVGGAFGLLRGLVFAVAAVLAMMAFAPNPPPSAVVNSRFSPYLIDVAHVCAAMAPKEIKDAIGDSYEEVRRAWTDAVKKGSAELSERKI